MTCPIQATTRDSDFCKPSGSSQGRPTGRFRLGQAAGHVQPDFQANTWEAFRRFAVDGRPAVEVAAELGLNVNSVIQAKSRILRSLREEAGELVG